MGQQITWQYHLVWAPSAVSPIFSVYRVSSAGHRFLWASAPAPELTGTPDLHRVLQELYQGLLVLMEGSC